MDALIISVGSRRRAIPLGPPIRIRCHLGSGSLRYLVDDGWLGVHLDADANPRRVDEVYVDHCRADETSDVEAPATPCDHTACDGKCDLLTAERRGDR